MKFNLILAFILLLLLCVNLSRQQQQQKQQNKKELSNEINCQHDLIPGMSLMEKGIDISSLDFYPMDAGINQENGYMESIFSFSCTNGLTWNNRADKSNTTFSKPDDVENLSYLPEGESTATSTIFSSLSETMSSLNAQAGIGGTYEGLGFSASGGVEYAKKAIYQSQQVFALTQTQISAYEIELKESMHFTEKFNKSVKNLPQKYSDNPDAYNDFLSQFGTHYFVNARFGGSVILRTNFEKNYTEKQNSLTLTESIKVSFVNVFNSELNMSQKLDNIDGHFEGKSNSSLYYFGGHPNLAKDAYMSDWFETVILDPWLFSGRLRSIDKIISTQNEYADKGKEVSIAIQVKLARKTLVDLEKSMIMSDFVKHSVKDLKESSELLAQMKDYFEDSKKTFELSELNESLKKLKKLLKYANVKPISCDQIIQASNIECYFKFRFGTDCFKLYNTGKCMCEEICEKCNPADVTLAEDKIRADFKATIDLIDKEKWSDCPQNISAETFYQPFCYYQPFLDT